VTLIFVLSLTSLFTALLSGVFGMAGGMLLMGVYAALLPVPTAMVMHGGTQLVANVTRAILLRKDVYWRGFAPYVLGALAAFATLRELDFVPDQLLVFLGLGLTPFVAALLPPRWCDFERPGAAITCGALVAAVQLLAGAAGPLLDVAFLETRLNRHQVVATKAATQVFSHTLKLVYFAWAVSDDTITLGLIVGVLCATLLGTQLGTQLLQRMTDQAFRRYSRLIVYAIGGVYLCRAGVLLWT
jgi:uncharacterized membrane protein YfcA